MRKETTRSARRLFAGAALLLAPLALIAGADGAAAAATLDSAPTGTDFGDVRVGDLIADPGHKVVFTNTSGAPVTIGSITNVGGQSRDFAGITGLKPDSSDVDPPSDCLKQPDGVTPRTLANGESCTVYVLAYPTGVGSRVTTMTVRDPADATLATVPLKAVGTVGYYVAGAFGEVQEFGDATSYGDATGLPLNASIVDIKQVPFGEGFYLLGLDGGVFNYGPDADFHGSTGGMQLNAPVVSIDSVDSEGYYLAASDGGVFNYGPDAPFHGSMGGKALNAPVVSIAADPAHDGYWLAATDGGVFAFGQAGFFKSMGGKHLNSPIVAIIPTPTGMGYFLVAEDGGVFAFGDAVFSGSRGGQPLTASVVDAAISPTGLGYWMLTLDGGVSAFGPDAPNLGNPDNIKVTTGITGTGSPTDVNGLGEGGFYVSWNDQTTTAAAQSAAVHAAGARQARAASAAKPATLRDQAVVLR
ncbi:MAG: hypothetical protein QOK43_153, partial [Acidimicrobiaceae bacterium]|nr:hypothetical protein [Acidimicrobiaceae bacterium]